MQHTTRNRVIYLQVDIFLPLICHKPETKKKQVKPCFWKNIFILTRCLSRKYENKSTKSPLLSMTGYRTTFLMIPSVDKFYTQLTSPCWLIMGAAYSRLTSWKRHSRNTLDTPIRVWHSTSKNRSESGSCDQNQQQKLDQWLLDLVVSMFQLHRETAEVISI